jgi:hypothetical protein
LHAGKEREERLVNLWKNNLEVFSDLCQDIKNPNDRSRTLEENKLLLLAHQKVESMTRGDLHRSSITWTSIEEAVAHYFCVRREYLTKFDVFFSTRATSLFSARKINEVVPPRSTTTPSKKRFPVKSFWNSQVY